MTLRPLEEIERDAAAATPGPWGHKSGVLKHYVFSTDDAEDFGVSLQEMHWRDGHAVPAEANARFIAQARTDVPALVARVRELEAASAHLRSERDFWRLRSLGR